LILIYALESSIDIYTYIEMQICTVQLEGQAQKLYRMRITILLQIFKILNQTKYEGFARNKC